VSNHSSWISCYSLPTGELVRFRHVSPDDAERIAEAIRTASPETMLHRFFSPIRTVPLPALRNLLRIDQLTDLCLLGELERAGDARIICGARYVRKAAGSEMAEIAVTVHDDFQRRGLGSHLLRQLASLAESSGITQFEGIILPSNVGMLRLIETLSPHRQRFDLGEIVRVIMPVEDLSSETKNS